MSFEKAAQKSKGSEVILEYQTALAEYKRACKAYTRLRLIADDSAATDADIVAHDRGRKLFKLQCKAYDNARKKFVYEMRALQNRLPSLTDATYMDVYEKTSFEELRKLQKEQVLKEEMDEGIAAGKYDDIIKAAKDHMNAGLETEEAEEQQFSKPPEVDEFAFLNDMNGEKSETQGE